MTAFSVVYVVDTTAFKASSAILSGAFHAIGITKGSALLGEVVDIQTAGRLPLLTSLPVGTYYLNVDGSLTSNPNTGIVQVEVGESLGSAGFHVRLFPSIVHA